MSATERVYKTHDNENAVRIRVSGESAPLTGVTRMTLELVEAAVTVDSDVSPTAITWNSNGRVTFKLGTQSANGVQTGILTAFDPDHPNGQVLAHPDGKNNRLRFEFIEN